MKNDFFQLFLRVFILRDPCKKTSGAGKAKIVLSRSKKIVEGHFPEWGKLCNAQIDNRMHKAYPMAVNFLDPEFIENDSEGDCENQDCEQKAFVRLAIKIKKYFPRLLICILADGLYLSNPIFDI